MRQAAKSPVQEERRPAGARSIRPASASRTELTRSVHNSPYVVAQRQRLNTVFGETVQKKGQPAPGENHTGLPDDLKSGIESLSGISLDNVKVHYNSSQPAQLNALAYAQGADIHIAPGQQEHLPHEAWHVVQQAQGRVRPTMQLKVGVPVNADLGLEREADVMGARAARGAKDLSGGRSVQRLAAANEGGPIQRHRGTPAQLYQQWHFRSNGFAAAVVAAAAQHAAAYFAEGADHDAVTQTFVDAATQHILGFAEWLDDGVEQEHFIDALTQVMQELGDGWFLKQPAVLRAQAQQGLQRILGAVSAAIAFPAAQARQVQGGMNL